MEQKAFGCMLSPYDIRDYKITASTDLPKEFSLDFSNVKVKNQGLVSSCVAHAMSTILEYHAKNRNSLSTNFIYGIRNELYNRKGKGMYLRDACKIVADYGDPIEEHCPGNTEEPLVYNVASCTFADEEKMKVAADFRVKAYYLCNGNEEIKTALYYHGPVLASIKWYVDNITINGVLTGGKIKKWASNHAIVIYGYNEKGFLCQNSWGLTWGRGGRFILPYDYEIREARGLVDMENETYITPPKKEGVADFFYKALNKIVNLFVRKI